jgi:hypothetical protein
MSEHETINRFWVPMLRGHLPDWSRAVPETHPAPALRYSDVALLRTVHVPKVVRQRWEGKPKWLG